MTQKWQRERKGKRAEDEEAPRAEALRLQRPLGQGEALQRWVRAARRLQLPHGIVVEGARGTGKSTVLQYLTAALLCPSELDEDEPCGVCRTCTRVANDAHPDVHVLRRAQDEAERKELKRSFYVLTVDQVREAEEQLRRHAIEGRARVCVIADADCLAEEGQNALLKTLEEPGAATFCCSRRRGPSSCCRRSARASSACGCCHCRRGAHGRAGEKKSTRFHRFDRAVTVAHGSLGMALHAATEHAVQLHDLAQGWLAETQNLRPVATARRCWRG